MVALDCTFEVDIRLPNGLDAPEILAEVDKIVASYPEVSYRQSLYNPPSWCPPDTEMAQLVRAECQRDRGHRPDSRHQPGRQRHTAMALQGHPGHRLWPVADRDGQR